MTKLLFVCTGNSARSQMAEGFARDYAGDRIGVASAGTHPVGLNPHAVRAMHEVGVDISRQTSDPLSAFRLGDFDCIVTLCGSARDSCPAVGAGVELHHWPLSDPAGVVGEPAEILEAFRIVRDQIEEKVKALLSTLVDPS